MTELDYLLARADDTYGSELVTDLAAALRAQTAETEWLTCEVHGVRESLAERAEACDDATATAAMHAATITRLERELTEARAATPVMDGNHISTTAGSHEALRADLAAMTAAAVRLHAGRIATVHQQWLKPDAHEPGNRYTPMTEAEIGAMEIVVTALDALEAGDG